MQREMDLVRLLLLTLEEMPKPVQAVRMFKRNELNELAEGYDVDAIDYHLGLLSKAGLLDNGGVDPIGGFAFQSLTWRGHDLADSIRDPVIWAKTKESAKQAGGFTIDLLGALAKGFIKKQIQDRTGIEIDL